MYSSNKKKEWSTSNKRQKGIQDKENSSASCSGVKSLLEVKNSMENRSFSGLNYDLMSDLFKGNDIAEVSRILNDSPPNESDFSHQLGGIESRQDILLPDKTLSSSKMMHQENIISFEIQDTTKKISMPTAITSQVGNRFDSNSCVESSMTPINSPHLNASHHSNLFIREELSFPNVHGDITGCTSPIKQLRLSQNTLQNETVNNNIQQGSQGSSPFSIIPLNVSEASILLPAENNIITTGRESPIQKPTCLSNITSKEIGEALVSLPKSRPEDDENSWQPIVISLTESKNFHTEDEQIIPTPPTTFIPETEEFSSQLFTSKTHDPTNTKTSNISEVDSDLTDCESPIKPASYTANTSKETELLYFVSPLKSQLVNEESSSQSIIISFNNPDISVADSTELQFFHIVPPPETLQIQECEQPSSPSIQAFSNEPGTSKMFLSDNRIGNDQESSIVNDNFDNQSESIVNESGAGQNFQETSANDNSSESDSNESLSSRVDTEEVVHTRKRKANPMSWKRNKAKLLRNSGQQYKTHKKGNLVPSRTMGPVCGPSCRLKCSEKFTEEERKDYFDKFWSLKDIIKQRHVIMKSLHAIKRKYRYPVNNSSRKLNHAFNFYKGDFEVRVCKKFYKSTLGITNRCIRTVIEKTQNGFLGEDLRGKHSNHPIISEAVKDRARNHLASIPTVESHYTRADSKKNYIEGGRTLSDIYKDYKLECEKEDCEIVSYSIFRQIFNYEFNLEFFKPKKDLCQYCECYKNMSQNERLDKALEYMRHHEEKDLSRAEKDEDKGKIDKQYRVACFDLQAALPTPKGEVSTFYYKSKLSTYNFTICDLKKKGLGTVNCYLWHEGEGHKGSNEIGSCLLNYLKSCEGESGNESEVVFYSDNCGGQGKNKFIIGAYLYAISNYNIKSITHKFLIVGHTQNEGDVAHSLIEKNIKQALKAGPIYLPAQYATLASTARKSVERFKIHELDHDFFFDLKELNESTSSNFNVNNDGEKFNFNDICIIKVEKEYPGAYFYKTSYKDNDYKCVNVSRSRTRKQLTAFINYNLKKAYTDSIAISGKKYQDLMALVTSKAIPRQHSDFFVNLKHD